MGKTCGSYFAENFSAIKVPGKGGVILMHSSTHSIANNAHAISRNLKKSSHAVCHGLTWAWIYQFASVYCAGDGLAGAAVWRECRSRKDPRKSCCYPVHVQMQINIHRRGEATPGSRRWDLCGIVCGSSCRIVWGERVFSTLIDKKLALKALRPLAADC